MIDDLKKIIEQVSDPADVATVLIAGTAGFLVDAGLNAVGFLEPGYVGITAASGALGLKKSAESYLEKRRVRKRANKLLMLLRKDDRYAKLAQRLEHELKLFESGITEVGAFKASLNKIIESYRSRS